MHRGDLDDVRVHVHAERAQERLAQRAAGDARGGLARGGPLEDVADVGLLVLLRAHQVGVAGARQVHLGDRLCDRPGVHPLLPVGVVAVGDLQRDRAAERAAVAHAGGDLGAVALDLHAPAAAVAELAAGHVGVERILGQAQAGGQALDDAGQAGAVGLAGGDQTEAHGQPAYLPVAMLARTGTGWRVGEPWPRVFVERRRRRSPQRPARLGGLAERALAPS